MKLKTQEFHRPLVQRVHKPPFSNSTSSPPRFPKQFPSKQCNVQMHTQIINIPFLSILKLIETLPIQGQIKSIQKRPISHQDLPWFHKQRNQQQKDTKEHESTEEQRQRRDWERFRLTAAEQIWDTGGGGNGDGSGAGLPWRASHRWRTKTGTVRRWWKVELEECSLSEPYL